MAKLEPDARRRAMDALARREHSRSELRAKLEARRHPPEEIARALDALEREGLLSDRRYADAWIESRARRGFGPRKIVFELRGKGVTAEVAAAALDAAEIDWTAAARRACARKFGDDPSAWPRDGRVGRYLVGRGYPADLAARLASPR